MTHQPILIVEDEFETAELLRTHLVASGLDVRVVHNGAAALESLKRYPVGMLIFNTMLTDYEGIEFCRIVKSALGPRPVPLVMLSAFEDESEAVEAFELGVSDYITKPCNGPIVAARVRAILRREFAGADAGKLPAANHALVIDPQRHSVTLDGKPLVLTLNQYKILQFLATEPGIVRSRPEIVAAIHGSHTVLSDRAIDVHVAALRQKMGEQGTMIQTVRGVGYRLAEDQTNWVSPKPTLEPEPALHERATTQQVPRVSQQTMVEA